MAVMTNDKMVGVRQMRDGLATVVNLIETGRTFQAHETARALVADLDKMLAGMKPPAACGTVDWVDKADINGIA